MANHCYNYVNFTGSVKNMTRLFKRLNKIKEEHDPKLTYDSITFWSSLYPKLLFSKAKESSAGLDVYDDYGSKWFECNYEVYTDSEGNITEINLSGDSAWSPMLPFFRLIARKYELSAEGDYHEPGMDFAGEFSIDALGNLEDRQCTYGEYQMEHEPEIFWENLTERIQEGYYKTIEEIYEEFNPQYWKLTKEEKVELQQIFNDILSNISGTNEQETD